MAEPTSDWGKELKSDLSGLKDNVRDLRQEFALGRQSSDQATERVERDVREIRDELKPLQGLKATVTTILAGIGTLVVLILAVTGSNAWSTSTTYTAVNDINRKLGGFEKSIEVLDGASQRLETTVAKASESFRTIEQKLDGKITEFDGKLKLMDEKISVLAKLPIDKQIEDLGTKLDNQINDVSGKLFQVQQSINKLSLQQSLSSRRSRHLSEFRTLRLRDWDSDRHMIALYLPESIREPTLVEQVSAFFPDLQKSNGADVLSILTQMDNTAESITTTKPVQIAISGISETELAQRLSSPAGLAVRITYVVREK